MMAYSPAAVARAFSRSWRPTLPGDSSWAAIPDPTTTAARNALPISSASWHLQRAVGCIGRSAAARGGGRTGTFGHRTLLADRGDAARTVPGDAGFGGRMGQHGVDLPGSAVGVLDPHLVLDREATGGLVLHLRGQTLTTQPIRGGHHL